MEDPSLGIQAMTWDMDVGIVIMKLVLNEDLFFTTRTFSKGIKPNVNVIALLEFELAYDEVIV